MKNYLVHCYFRGKKRLIYRGLKPVYLITTFLVYQVITIHKLFLASHQLQRVLGWFLDTDYISSSHLSVRLDDALNVDHLFVSLMHRPVITTWPCVFGKAP